MPNIPHIFSTLPAGNVPSSYLDDNFAVGGAYTPPGTGAVATTVAGKLGESVSVLDFGVNTTPGTTDMTAAIQAASTYVNSIGGGNVYFPPGTYLSGSIGYGSNTNFIGSGVGVTILKHYLLNPLSAAGITVQPFYPLTLGVTATSNISFSDMTIDGNTSAINWAGYAGDGNHQLGFWTTTGVFLNNLIIKNMHTDGLTFAGLLASSQTSCTQVYANNIWIDNAGRNGVSAIGLQYASLSNFYVSNVTGTTPKAMLDIEPTGTFAVNSDIQISNWKGYNCSQGLSLAGAAGNQNNRIQITNFDSGIVQSSYNLYCVYSNDVQINGFQGDANPATTTTNNIYLAYSARPSLQDVEVKNANQLGMKIDFGVTDFNGNNIRVFTPNLYGIQVVAGVTGNLNNSLINGASTGSSGIFTALINYSSGVTYRGITVEGTTHKYSFGNYIAGVSYLDCNFISGVTGLYDTASSILSNCNFTGTTADGLLWERPSRVIELYDDFLGATINSNTWTSAKGSNGSCALPAVSAGALDGKINMVTGADAGATMALDGTQLTSGLNWSANQDRLEMSFTLNLSGTTTVQCFGGFADATSLYAPFTNTADVITANATNGFGILFDTAATTLNWWLVGVKAGVHSTPQQLGVAPNSGTYEDWRIVCDATGSVTVYRNRVAIGTAMANAVTTTTRLTAYIGGFSRAAGNRTLTVGYVNVKMHRP